MDTLKTFFAVIGVIASVCSLGAVGVYLLLRYEDRQWRKKQDAVDGACKLPANDN